ncbi:hypothetical protein M2164_004932 [Streptomyces sp. SAI-208]|uniref:DUF6227 family protein n=1 Tax=unclassified Streptomyces TaxID=2593676 RepID=UPI0024738F01|nr:MULTISPECIES: DUF6227 family protein [unclassified Streptomyces]MDH6518451.1 hypothetical protein [Streptomyces sp. SAI-090]MDH6550670.1 hypothetical protein [Streptomyces sp. SAI-041]MDH6569733.1 hypothetical protein [Streptomyces sp. SAI-117]MDH6585310.1 hypothetical protein [Streptomyces sp. SAI-133]MDH6609297.1 hypothetical protein [Streptomyces sp. SAI-208]
MSVPYETAAYEPPESPESPEEHLARLLGRALNSFELPDETIRRLDCALAHDSSLHSAHHSAGLHRETYRHTWLLSDGSALTLWELVHNTARDSVPQHEVYVDEEELRAATMRLPLPPDTPDFELPVTVQLAPVQQPRHAYVPDDSADHARRLLRRAENTDRPGPETAALLTQAFAHQITQAFGRPCRAGRAGLGFSLYEHAFLLRDGAEVSLWEVEHTATPDGRHMCEVYVTEDAAREAMERRAAHLS